MGKVLNQHQANPQNSSSQRTKSFAGKGRTQGKKGSQTVSPAVVNRLLDYLNGTEREKAYVELKSLHQQYPGDVDVLHLLGVAAYHMRRYQEGITTLEERLSITPIPSMPSSMSRYHHISEAKYFLALLKHEVGEYRQAADILKNLEADASIPPAIARKACSMAGRTLHVLDENNDAIDYLKKSLALEPTCGVTWANLAKVYVASGRMDDALEAHDKALAYPANQNAKELRNVKMSLASLLKRIGDEEKFQKVYQELIDEEPTYGLILEQSLYLPNIYNTLEEVVTYRDRYIQNLMALLQESPKMDNLHNEVCVSLTFLLAYHGESDKDLMQALGHLIHQGYSPAPLPPRPKRQPGQKIRVGVISRHWSRNHTIGKLYTGIFENLNADDFEVVMFHVVPNFHPNSHKGWVKNGHIYKAYLPEQNRPLATAILHKAELDILFYSDIGMDTTTYFQAFERVAPAQCVTFGHPSTSGIPNMDYFFSCKHMESDNAQQYYTEELIQLDTVPTHYRRPTLEREYDKAYFGFDDNKNYYVCPQSLFKMHPEIDEIFKGILDGDPNGVLVLLAGHTVAWRQQLVARFNRTLGEALTSRIHWQERLSRRDFVGMMKVCDVMLDPIHFGGGNTSYEAFSFGTPVVTCPGKFLKSKITEAAYRMMGYTELIVDSYQAFVDKSLELGMNPDKRAQVSQTILDCCDVLYENNDTVREIEAEFKRMVAVAEANGAYSGEEASTAL